MNIQDRDFSIGVVGGGEGAEKALAAIVGCEGIRIGAAACKDWELKDFDPLVRLPVDDLFSRKDIDAVYIATPNNTHVDLAMAGIDAGKHVMVEKPLGASFDDALRLLPLVSRNETIAVAFKKRYGVGIKHLKNAMAEEKDAPVCVDVKWYNPYPGMNWRCQHHVSGGGVLVDLGSHVFDLLEFVLGKIVWLKADLEMSEAHVNIDKTANIELEFENGHSALIDLSWARKEVCQEYNFNFSGKVIHLQRKGGGVDLGCIKTESWQFKWNFKSASEYIGLFSAWRTSVTRGGGMVPGLEDGLKNQSIIQALYDPQCRGGIRLECDDKNCYKVVQKKGRTNVRRSFENNPAKK